MNNQKTLALIIILSCALFGVSIYLGYQLSELAQAIGQLENGR